MIREVEDKSGWRRKFAFFPTTVEVGYKKYTLWLEYYWAKYKLFNGIYGEFYAPDIYSLTKPEEAKDGSK